MRFRVLLPTLAFGGFLALACGGITPVPPTNSDMVGSWEGSGVVLEIQPSGQIRYETGGGSGSNFQYNGPVQKWDSNGFTYGVFGIETNATVSGPTEEGGVWKMTVDGVELTKK